MDPPLNLYTVINIIVIEITQNDNVTQWLCTHTQTGSVFNCYDEFSFPSAVSPPWWSILQPALSLSPVVLLFSELSLCLTKQ